MGSILGGKGSSQSSSNVSGYAALPQELKDVFNQLGTAVGQYTNPNNPGVTGMFSPLQQTADETSAINAIRQGFAPNASSIASDIAMQTNPFDQSVIDTINREAQGQGSVLNQQLSGAGQLGSNRGMLSANDIDLTRLNQIGTFKQGQYNTALNNALNVLPQSRANDAAGLMNIGSFQRNLDTSTKQAPVNALSTGIGLISPFTSGGTSTSSGSAGGAGLLGGIGQLAAGIGGFGTMMGWSDIRLKEDIVRIGERNGYPVYEYNYAGDDVRYEGVMAQDVMEVEPEAVGVGPGGYMMVNYARIGVPVREVRHGR